MNAPKKSAVFLTHSPLESTFRVGSHQLTKVLDERGWRVLHIPTPTTPFHVPMGLFNSLYRKRLGHVWRSFRKTAQDTFEFIPFSWIPWQFVQKKGERGPGLYARGQLGAAGRIRKHLFDQPEILFVDEPRFAGMRAWFRPKICLYRATDLYAALRNEPSLVDSEKKLLREVDGFVATSQPVYDHLHSLAPHLPGIVVQNGVELSHFASSTLIPEDLKNIPTPRAIYVGAFDERFDSAAVVALAKARPNLSVVLIGPGQPSAPANTEPMNLFRLGARPYSAIPSYLQYAQVGLLPMTDHPANRGRSPMKIYEYGAAGLPVVARRTEELGSRALEFVLLYNEHEEMILAVDQALAQRKELSAQARRISSRMSWESRLEEILTFTEEIREKSAVASSVVGPQQA